ncbi:Helicase associated domain [Seminavis robusta]|uniref:Helicase associated domain n=1 Tax=Seminavis robusta TaxID=568900 RepID=A0A9N8DHU3_9STRA|nr:Helicase associated domain [Seminavis robusta]|eukprot:Sro135_g063700.1 Helicase associated domain (510) ;mRNA; r:25320-26849
MFQRLKEFYKEHGHSIVPPDYHDKELYKWSRNVRRNYQIQFTQRVRQKKAAQPTSSADVTAKRRPRLSESKGKLLASVDFCWDLQNATWELQYQELVDFLEKHGHEPVHSENPSLTVWLSNQRREYRFWVQDLPTNLTPERLEKFQELGVFDDYRTQQEAWAQYYQYLVEYHQRFGNAHVPQNYQHSVVIKVINGDGGDLVQRHTTFALGKWCMNQRTARRHWDELHGKDNGGGGDDHNDYERNAANHTKQKGSGSDEKSTTNIRFITAERIRLLDALDFSWNLKETQWQIMLNRLQEYFQRHGHLKIPTSDYANRDLRKWLINQRHHYHIQRRRPPESSPMTPFKISSMEEAIPNFSWKYYNSSGPTVQDWSNLFSAIRDKGIAPGMRPKQHWFEGENPFAVEVKSDWTEEELIDLWNQEEDEEDDDDDDFGKIADGSFTTSVSSSENEHGGVSYNYYVDMDDNEDNYHQRYDARSERRVAMQRWSDPNQQNREDGDSYKSIRSFRRR